ncbi:HU family DNA-binding protein (plasmid) [Deinococcus sp. KNUC1210]|uniref:HU family DNA-binding protein n=1 Tax=Deinococcus sp. KNUC1210 TaxID=2917691 RepID=UPI001EF00D44|nr:HU family DNA-binding protein [Deinococcus sp. KNUC1210]ULH18067.1 HU family DNA-binding protein [Deinococcus sp. KNUC1210]
MMDMDIESPSGPGDASHVWSMPAIKVTLVHHAVPGNITLMQETLEPCPTLTVTPTPSSPRVGRVQLTAQLQRLSQLDADQSTLAVRIVFQVIKRHLELGTAVSLPGLGTLHCEGQPRRVVFRPARFLNQHLQDQLAVPFEDDGVFDMDAER